MIKQAVHYFEDKYTGPDEGTVLVHVREIHKDVLSIPEACRIDQEQGVQYVKRIIPSAVHRVGCDGPCCHGDGPDLEILHETLDNGNLLIKYIVDFDFRYKQGL